LSLLESGRGENCRTASNPMNLLDCTPGRLTGQ
jgi:hypothetical protein